MIEAAKVVGVLDECLPLAEVVMNWVGLGEEVGQVVLTGSPLDA